MVNSTTKRVWTLDLKGTRRHISVEDFYSSRVSENIKKEFYYTERWYCLLNLCYVFHFRKGKWAVWATKMILNTHVLCLSARLLTFNHALTPISLPRLYCSGKQLQINTGRCEQPGDFECNSGIHKNPGLCTCTTVNTREDIFNAEMLFITFPILPWHKGYFLIKQVTGITASALMTKWR